MFIAGALVLGLALRPQALVAQQSASVLVRVNVINVPVAPAAFDSLSHMVRDSVSSPTRARAIAHARDRGLRVTIGDSSTSSRAPAGAGSPASPASPPEVLLMEYVAN